MAMKITKQDYWVIIGASVIILSSVLTTLIASYFLAREEPNFKNVTLTDAVMACESEIRSKFGPQLAKMTVDNHSTRLDQSSDSFKTFFDVEIKREQSHPKGLYVNCFVNASKGNVIRFRSFDKSGEKDSGEGLFMWFS